LQIPENLSELLADVTLSLLNKSGFDPAEAEQIASLVGKAERKEYGGMFEAVIQSIKEGRQEAWEEGLFLGREEGILIGNIEFEGFRTSHDSLDCFGYKFLFENGRSAAIATDLGFVGEDIKKKVAGCDFIGLESNYDSVMLKTGPYPSYLKRRIASSSGHLSNTECSSTVSYLAQNGTSKFSLLHLSAENNSPDIALTTCLGVLENEGVNSCLVSVAPRHQPGKPTEI